MGKEYELKRACREVVSILANALENETLIYDNSNIADETINMAAKNVRSRSRKKQQSSNTHRSKKDEGI